VRVRIHLQNNYGKKGRLPATFSRKEFVKYFSPHKKHCPIWSSADLNFQILIFPSALKMLYAAGFAISARSLHYQRQGGLH